MANLPNDQELEVKFFLADLEGIEKRLSKIGANLIQPRTHEYNLRFDTPAGDLSQASRVLRLRRDSGSHLTYKGPSETLEGVLARQEIEFEINNFDAARRFIEALGFRSKFVYEKFRTTYDLQGFKITLDEMPYGHFIEIEGQEASAIQDTARRLELDWDAAIPETYISLFRRLKELSGFPFADLTFDNFAGISVDVERIGIKPADAAVVKK
jgi:adenylate cyclase class 2